jgi:acetyl-CoA synthetase
MDGDGCLAPAMSRRRGRQARSDAHTEIAFIVLKPGVPPTQELASEIQDFVRHRLSAHEYPREVAFIDDMPMTTTGKVIRRLLRARG